MSEPLIYTKRGNEPQSGLMWSHEWQFGQRDETGFPLWVSFKEVWRDKETGEVVKEGGGVYHAGIAADGQTQEFGG